MALKTDFKQSHFILYELQLPYMTVCTPVEGLTEAWHTPLTCTEPVSDAVYSLWFTDNAAPITQPPTTSINIKSRLNSSVWRVVSSGSETTPILKPGEGMASRGTMSVNLSDFKGDPGPINFSEDGTFFGKLLARNVLDGKKIISHYYTITDGAPELVRSPEHYIENATLTNGSFKISAKDALKDLEKFSQQFPVPSEIDLTADIDATTTTIPVSDGSIFSSEDVIIIDEELMRVSSITGNNLNVYTRGLQYNAQNGSLIYKTEVSSHSSGSDVQLCYVMNESFLADVLSDIFIAADLSDLVDLQQWTDEIMEWNQNAYLYGVFHDPSDVDDTINQLLTNYMVDMWYDQETKKAVVSAISAWKPSGREIVEGDDFNNLRTETKSNTRFSRAYIRSGKEYQARNDDTTNYSQFTIHKDTGSESSDFYGAIKLKEFDPSGFITRDSAAVLVARYVQRFSKTPPLSSFTMEERKLAGTGLGDVINIVSRDTQSPAGAYTRASTRAQVIEVRPNLNGIGRTYNVKTLAYIPPTQIEVITGTVESINLFTIAGEPNPEPNQTFTFIFDGATIGSIEGLPSIRAGSFDPTTNIRLIFAGGCQWSALGGRGGGAFIQNELDGGTATLNATTTDATNGGDCYQSDGIATEIYLNYGEVDGYQTDGDLFAAGGGGASSSIAAKILNDGAPVGTSIAVGAASSGGGGSGIPFGAAGTASKTVASQGSGATDIINGFNGTFETAGAGNLARGYDEKTFIGEVKGEAVTNSGGGGFSLGGSSATATATAFKGAITQQVQSIGNAGLAGGAIKGANVTVYCIAAQLNRLRDGNSDSYTLIFS